jgi:type VI secretion system protein ImpC
MEALMGTPTFREMEALWRSVIFLLSRIEVSSKLRVYLIDVSEEELAADLLSSDEPSEWRFAHTVLRPVSEHGEALRWAALLGYFEFGNEPHQIPLLQRLGLLAEVDGIPWFSAASSALLGTPSISDHPDPRDWSETQDPLWLQLRERQEATCINLSFPGFLLRSPYGFGTSKVKTFGFSQDAAFPRDLLWGNPCILWGILLGRAFSRSGWNLRISGQESLHQLPTHPAPGGWETPIPAALSQTGAARAREMGVNPVVSPRGESQVTLLGYGSVSSLEPGLKAWWKNPV